jgi:hypothetical protein
LSLPAFTKTASTPMLELQSKLPGVPLSEATKLLIVNDRVPSVVVPFLRSAPWIFSSSQVALLSSAKSAQVGLPVLMGVGVTDAAKADGANAETASIAAADIQPAVRTMPPPRREVEARVFMVCKSPSDGFDNESNPR